MADEARRRRREENKEEDERRKKRHLEEHQIKESKQIRKRRGNAETVTMDNNAMLR